MKVPAGGTLGILGGGQLGQMLCLEARRLGYRTAVLDADATCPARAYADHFVQGRLTDAQAALRLADLSDVVTVETEHVPVAVLEEVARRKPVRPQPSVLGHVQDRLAQRRFLASIGVPQPVWAPVHDETSLAAAAGVVPGPSILKTRHGGYDGKGQARSQSGSGVRDAWEALGRKPCVLEGFVMFEREVSAILARGEDGQVRHFDLAWNEHRAGVLHTTVVPAPVPDPVVAEARRTAERIAAGLGHVGVLCVEFFLQADGMLLVNEVAPRVHNSGHYTLGAGTVSQFEQHARAVLGLPLRQPRLLSPVTMLNVLGDAWSKGPPAWDAVHREPRAQLFLYGKVEARPGRKMAHVLVLDPDVQETRRAAERIHEGLVP